MQEKFHLPRFDFDYYQKLTELIYKIINDKPELLEKCDVEAIRDLIHIKDSDNYPISVKMIDIASILMEIKGISNKPVTLKLIITNQ